MRVFLIELASRFEWIGVEHQFLQQNGVDAFFGITILLLIDHSDDGRFVAYAQLYVDADLLMGLKLGTSPYLPDMCNLKIISFGCVVQRRYETQPHRHQVH